MKTPDGVQIATLTRLWNAARSLGRIRAAAGAQEPSRDGPANASASPSAPTDPLLWNSYELRILDVRAAQSFALQHIPESGSVAAAELGERIYELPPRWRELVVVSDDPGEAIAAAGMLRERGWHSAVPLIESLTDWPGPWESGPAPQLLWEPAPLVRRWASRIPPGRVADLGCGAGRDAVYLALHGLAVVAIDRLPDALTRARALAERIGVEIETRELDLRHGPPALAEPLAAVVMVRCHHAELFGWAREALAPGGLFLLEAFAQEPAREVGGANASRSALDPRALLGAFATPHGASESAASFDILEYSVSPDRAGEKMVRLAARRRDQG
jgi:tellurite methyltransferase